MTFNMLELGGITTSPDEAGRTDGRSVGENENKAKLQPY